MRSFNCLFGFMTLLLLFACDGPEVPGSPTSSELAPMEWAASGGPTMVGPDGHTYPYYEDEGDVPSAVWPEIRQMSGFVSIDGPQIKFHTGMMYTGNRGIGESEILVDGDVKQTDSRMQSQIFPGLEHLVDSVPWLASTYCGLTINAKTEFTAKTVVLIEIQGLTEIGGDTKTSHKSNSQDPCPPPPTGGGPCDPGPLHEQISTSTPMGELIGFNEPCDGEGDPDPGFECDWVEWGLFAWINNQWVLVDSWWEWECEESMNMVAGLSLWGEGDPAFADSVLASATRGGRIALVPDNRFPHEGADWVARRTSDGEWIVLVRSSTAGISTISEAVGGVRSFNRLSDFEPDPHQSLRPMRMAGGAAKEEQWVVSILSALERALKTDVPGVGMVRAIFFTP